MTLFLVKKHYFFVIFRMTTVQTCGCAHHVNSGDFLESGLNSEITENYSPGQSYILNAYIALCVGKGLNSIV